MLSLAPWLLLGAVIAGLLHGLLPSHWIRSSFRGPMGVVRAVVLGVPLPLCSCGVIPTGMGLKKEGASDGATVGFLISTPQTGVDSILVSASFLGWPFALFKVGAAALTGVVGGWLTDATDGDAGTDLEVVASTGGEERKSAREMLDYAVDLLRMLWRWVAVGVLVSAAINVWVPAGALAAVADWPPLLTGLAALTFSLPLYVCATASVPIAAALVAGGVPAGAALVFLMAGPASNVATVGAVYRALGRRPLAVYLSTLVIGSLGLGLLFDFLVPTTSAVTAMQEHAVKPWEPPAAVLLTLLMLWFAGTELRRWWQLRRPDSDAITVAVQGMTCDGCINTVERAVREVPGVSSAHADLTAGEVVVGGQVNPEAVRQAINASGYQTDEASR